MSELIVTQETPKKRPSALKPPPKSKKLKAKEESEAAEEALEEELEASTEGSIVLSVRLIVFGAAFCFKVVSSMFHMKFMQVPAKKDGENKADAVTETLKEDSLWC